MATVTWLEERDFYYQKDTYNSLYIDRKKEKKKTNNTYFVNRMKYFMAG